MNPYDPADQQKVRDAFGGDQRFDWQKLWDAIKQAPGDVVDVFGGLFSGGEGPRDRGDNQTLGENTADFVEEYRAADGGIRGEGEPDEGRGGYGMGEIEMGTPGVGVRPVGGPGEAVQAAGEASDPVAADFEYITGGSPNDRYSRFRRWYQSNGGNTNRDAMAWAVSDAVREATGEDPRIRTDYELNDFLQDDEMLMIALEALGG